jgi:uncharacterized protein
MTSTCLAADLERVARQDGQVEGRQAVAVGGVADHARALAQRLDGLDVVVVVVGDKDVRQAPVPAVQRGADGRGLGRVHQSRGARPLVVDQEGVVVLEARHGDESEAGAAGHGGTGFLLP